MGSLYQVHKNQKRKVKKRQAIVEMACEQLLQEGSKLTKETISERTALLGEKIPAKTLEAKRYNEIINSYRIFTNGGSNNSEVEKLKNEIKILTNAFEKLRKQNKVLLTKLFELGYV